jgi:hypothetical protein
MIIYRAFPNMFRNYKNVLLRTVEQVIRNLYRWQEQLKNLPCKFFLSHFTFLQQSDACFSGEKMADPGEKSLCV